MLTVVLPAFNSARSLPRAIASVRAQTWAGPTEILLVDDGSTDDTARVAAAASGNDLHYIWQPNAGPAAARNRGLEASRGEWVAFLDADDEWLPQKLALQFEGLHAHPDAGFCYGDCTVIEPGGRRYLFSSGPAGSALLPALLLGNCLATPTILARRHCFEQTGGFDVELRTGEDWDMWIRLAARFPSVAVKQPLTLVLRNADQGRYPVALLERCTVRVLDRLFSQANLQQARPELLGMRARVYAWHLAVLAKSYLRRGQIGGFIRLALRSVRCHPAGLHYLGSRGARPSLA